jgi:hypothetical protein
MVYPSFNKTFKKLPLVGEGYFVDNPSFFSDARQPEGLHKGSA